MNCSIETAVTAEETRFTNRWKVRVTVKVNSDICGIYERQYQQTAFSKGEATADMLDFLSGEIDYHIQHIGCWRH